MARDPVKHAANQRAYYARHREEILAKMKEDKEHINEVHRKRVENNRDKKRASDKRSSNIHLAHICCFSQIN